MLQLQYGGSFLIKKNYKKKDNKVGSFFFLLEKKISCYLCLQAFWLICWRNPCCGGVFIFSSNMAVVHHGGGFQLKQSVCGAADGSHCSF